MGTAKTPAARKATRSEPYRITEEERQRRAERARQLHQQIDPETGRRLFGGPQPGSGRPRKKRAAEIVAEAAERSAKDIIDAFKDALDPEQPASVRLQAAKQWLEVENREAALQLQEDKELKDLDQDALIERVAGAILRLGQTPGFRGRAESRAEFDVEGSVVELGPGGS